MDRNNSREEEYISDWTMSSDGLDINQNPKQETILDKVLRRCLPNKEIKDGKVEPSIAEPVLE